jgi:hypothetical protein
MDTQDVIDFIEYRFFFHEGIEVPFDHRVGGLDRRKDFVAIFFGKEGRALLRDMTVR